MKATYLPIGILFLTAVSIAQGEPASERTDGPCFRVTIQNDPVNRSQVRQDCDYNVSRTVQAGATNHASTYQSGRVNDNKVRQYHYDVPSYMDRMGNRPQERPDADSGPRSGGRE